MAARTRQEIRLRQSAMVFDSSGTLVYNVHVENGTVVDANGNPVSGCSVDSDGYVVDAYIRIGFDPTAGS